MTLTLDEVKLYLREEDLRNPYHYYPSRHSVYNRTNEKYSLLQSDRGSIGGSVNCYGK